MAGFGNDGIGRKNGGCCVDETELDAGETSISMFARRGGLVFCVILNFGRSKDDLESNGFDFFSLLSILVVFVAVVFEEIFRRIAASNSCSRPCGLSIFRGGGVRTSSGIIFA